MGEDYLYDAALAGEDTWQDFWRLNGEARITIQRHSLSGGNKALMSSPTDTPTLIKGVKVIVFEVDLNDIKSAAGRLVAGDRKFETLDEMKYGDSIIFDDETYDVFRIDTINIGEMRIYSTKAHKVK